jgi:hypothetical protein
MRLNFPFPGGVVNWLLVPASQTRTQPSAAHGKRCFGASQRNFVILFALRRVAAGFSQFTGSGREWLHRARARMWETSRCQSSALWRCFIARRSALARRSPLWTCSRVFATPGHRPKGHKARLQVWHRAKQRATDTAGGILGAWRCGRGIRYMSVGGFSKKRPVPKNKKSSRLFPSLIRMASIVSTDTARQAGFGWLSSKGC